MSSSWSGGDAEYGIVKFALAIVVVALIIALASLVDIRI